MSRLFIFGGILLLGILPRNILLRGIFLRRDFAGRDFSLEGFCKRDFPQEGFLVGGIQHPSRALNFALQLSGNQKGFNFQLHHRFSKFEVPVVVNSKHIFELCGLYTTFFLIQKLLKVIRSSSDSQFQRKSQNKKGGKFELRPWLSYYN